MTSSPGKLVILSGPSGVGKSTIVRRLIDESHGRLRLSVSATTRGPRPGEIPGEHYHFLTPTEFAARREAGDFLECVEVFGRGHWYGTLRSEVLPSLQRGIWVILEIDVDGAERVLEAFPHAVTIFIAPSTPEELERRLRQRGTEDEAGIARRLEVARHELDRRQLYTHQVVNDRVDDAVTAIQTIISDHGMQA
jgi:guanylate kinase